MGFYPCSVHGAFFKGPAEAAYPAVVYGTSSERSHLRMCHDCFTSFIALCESKLSEVVAGERPSAPDQRVCAVCGGAGTEAAIFVSAYPKGAEGRQFFGPVCLADMGAARAAFYVTE